MDRRPARDDGSIKKMETGNPPNPDKIAEEKRRVQKAQTEDRIAGVEAWLLTAPTSHPEWQKRVSELNALYVKLAQINKDKPEYGFDATPYRLAINPK